jgi:ADP-ribose pyrophosphatase YjhB (NUDIX family)
VSVTNNAVVRAALGYVERNPAELEAVRDLVVLALLGPPVTLPDTFPAHLACQAVVVSPDWRLLQVGGLARPGWHLPGGHVDGADGSLLGATLRQLRRLTGIDPDVLRLESTLPFDIAAVTVEPAPTLSEPRHVHYDFRYLLQLPSSDFVAAGLPQRWVPASDVPGRLGEKLRHGPRQPAALG